MVNNIQTSFMYNIYTTIYVQIDFTQPKTFNVVKFNYLDPNYV